MSQSYFSVPPSFSLTDYLLFRVLFFLLLLKYSCSSSDRCSESKSGQWNSQVVSKTLVPGGHTPHPSGTGTGVDFPVGWSYMTQLILRKGDYAGEPNHITWAFWKQRILGANLRRGSERNASGGLEESNLFLHSVSCVCRRVARKSWTQSPAHSQQENGALSPIAARILILPQTQWIWKRIWAQVRSQPLLTS